MTAPTTVRLPPGLRAEAESYAELVGCSLSGLVGVALRDYLDARRMAMHASASAPLPPAPAVEALSAPAAVVRQAVASRVSAGATVPEKVSKQGFHDPCRCGSGKKFGKCHGRGKGRK